MVVVEHGVHLCDGVRVLALEDGVLDEAFVVAGGLGGGGFHDDLLAVDLLAPGGDGDDSLQAVLGGVVPVEDGGVAD